MKHGNVNFWTKSICISATNIFTLQHITHFLIYVIKLRNIEKHQFCLFASVTKWPNCQLKKIPPSWTKKLKVSKSFITTTTITHYVSHFKCYCYTMLIPNFITKTLTAGQKLEMQFS